MSLPSQSFGEIAPFIRRIPSGPLRVLVLGRISTEHQNIENIARDRRQRASSAGGRLDGCGNQELLPIVGAVGCVVDRSLPQCRAGVDHVGGSDRPNPRVGQRPVSVGRSARRISQADGGHIAAEDHALGELSCQARDRRSTDGSIGRFIRGPPQTVRAFGSGDRRGERIERNCHSRLHRCGEPIHAAMACRNSASSGQLALDSKVRDFGLNLISRDTMRTNEPGP